MATFETLMVSEFSALLGSAYTNKIAWEGQTNVRPALPYVSLAQISMRAKSLTPAVYQVINPTGTPGQTTPTVIVGTELLTVIETTYDVTIRLQHIFASPTSAGKLQDALARASLPPALLRSKTNGYVIHTNGLYVQRIPELMNNVQFEGREFVDVRVTMTRQVTDTETYISEADVTGSVSYAGETPPVFTLSNTWEESI